MKKRDVIVSDDSVVDIENSIKFYDKQKDGLGQYFFDCIYSDLESLRFYAGIHSKHFEYYRMFSKRFPFAIYYDIFDNLTRVVAVLDMRCDPNTIKRKLNDRK